MTMMAIVARTAACAIVHLGFTFKPPNPESEALFSRAFELQYRDFNIYLYYSGVLFIIVIV